MRRYSQKELQQEAFADMMRGIASAAKATAEIVAPEIMNPLKGYAGNVAKIRDAFSNKNPVSFVKRQLKENYYNTFNLKSIDYKNMKEIKLAGEKDNSNRIGVEFFAERYKTPQAAAPVPAAQQGGQNPTPPSYQQMARYVAILIRGPKGFEMEIRDNNNRIIRGVKDRKTRTRFNWDDEWDDADFTTLPTYGEMRAWITHYLPRDSRSLQSYFNGTNIDNILKNILGNNNIRDLDQLTDQDIEAIKQTMKRVRLFEYSQLNTLKQLQILNESVNSRHE